MKRFFYLLLVVQISSIVYGQKTKVDNGQFEMDVITAKKLSKLQDRTLIILDSDKLKTIFIKLEMTSTDGEKKDFDVNKFILLDTVNMLKIRLLDASHQNFSAYVGFKKMSKRPNPFAKFKKNAVIFYDPSIKDTFEDYTFQDYMTCEIPINYGKRKKPDEYIIYYEPKQFSKKKLILLFPFPKNIMEGTLYYGDEKIANLEFK